MADETRTATQALALERLLEGAPYRFEFFEALRRLECAHADKPRIGRSQRLADQPIRLGQEPSLAFAPSTIANFTGTRDGKPARLNVFFFGLFGPNGPLPLHLTQYAEDRWRDHHDPTFRRFADVFHHRLLSMFYRAWADTRPTINFDRPDADRFALYTGSLFGIASDALRGRDDVHDLAKFYHAGTFGCQTRHADGLRGMLAEYFEVPAEIEQFVGAWLDLPHESCWRLGESPMTGSLGRTTVLGERVWDCQQKFSVIFGPLTLRDYERLLPSETALDRLAALIRSYVGDELMWDVKLILRKEDVPRFRLGGEQRLGWTSWLIGRTPPADADDLVLNVVEAPRRRPAEEDTDATADHPQEFANV